MRPLTVPLSPIEPVTEVFFGTSIADHYRWLEDQNSQQTRAWIEEQTTYARSYLDKLRDRVGIRERVADLTDVEAYDSFVLGGGRYFFRKKLRGQEQPPIYMRHARDDSDLLLLDPANYPECSPFRSVKPLKASADGRLLLYETREKGTKSAQFQLLDVETRYVLPDSLPKGYLRGFVFAPDSKSFYYVHEPLDPSEHSHRAVYHHVLGAPRPKDVEIFSAGADGKLRMCLIDGGSRLAFLVYHFRGKTYTSLYLKDPSSSSPAEPILEDAEYLFIPLPAGDRLFALTNLFADNLRIVEVSSGNGILPLFTDVVPNGSRRIRQCAIAGRHLVVCFVSHNHTEIEIFDFRGTLIAQLPWKEWETTRIAATSHDTEEIVLEVESFVQPAEIRLCTYPLPGQLTWSKRAPQPSGTSIKCKETHFPSMDGTQIPIFLLGKEEAFLKGPVPTVMTSYGGYGVSLTPFFSVLVACLIEWNCIFALPQIRGGAEYGTLWHEAARRHHRQVAYDDFIRAAEWLVESGLTSPHRLGIFGGSNAGLLVAVALTQRPDLFRAVLCLVPLLDMLRYHLFDNAHVWIEEFGTSDNQEDFEALRRYSPYHNVKDGVPYPSVLIVSGDSDQTCNAMHARKMAARLQAANSSRHPILIDHTPYRGHAPVLPLNIRIDALTDRLAFLCSQLNIPIQGRPSC